MHSDPFLQQLAELVHNERTANKWILVPTNDVGWMLSERLVREGTNWINLRFTTPFALALDAAAPGLIERNIDPCPDLLGPSLLQSILAEHHPQVLLPGVAKAMWTALHEARMAGVTPGAYEQPYLEYLLKHQLADRAMVYAHAGATKVSPDDFILPYPYHIWNPLERHFFEGLPARHLTPQATTVQAPRRASRRQPMEVQPQRTIHLFYAGRRDLEFQEILRRIDRPFDEVELAAHSEDLPLLLDVFTEAGCPVTFAEGLPLALSRPAQALNGFLQWMEGGYRMRWEVPRVSAF
jgi:hypothetical protein